jgi:acetolactate synthase-1/3 small subunit
MEKLFTLIIVTENNIGLLNHVTVVFTRRKMNIRSITASESKIKDIYSYTLVLKCTDELIRKVAKQLEKIIGVFKVFVYEEHEVIHQELALYKLPVSVINDGINFEQLVREHNARILNIEKEYILIEKTGHKSDTQALLEALQPFGVLQFIRSGRVAMAKPMKPLEEHLKEKEEAYEYN